MCNDYMLPFALPVPLRSPQCTPFWTLHPLFLFLFSNYVKWVLSLCPCVWGHPLECGHTSRCHASKENCRFLFQQPSTATGSWTRGGVSWHPPSSMLECDWLGFVQATTTAPVQLCSSLVCLKDSNLQNSSLSQALPFFMTLFSQCLLSFVDKAVLL